MDIRRLSYSLGAEISGIDLSKPIDDAISNNIYKAFLDHSVLLFRGTPLSMVSI